VHAGEVAPPPALPGARAQRPRARRVLRWGHAPPAPRRPAPRRPHADLLRRHHGPVAAAPSDHPRPQRRARPHPDREPRGAAGSRRPHLRDELPGPVATPAGRLRRCSRGRRGASRGAPTGRRRRRCAARRRRGRCRRGGRRRRSRGLARGGGGAHREAMTLDRSALRFAAQECMSCAPPHGSCGRRCCCSCHRPAALARALLSMLRLSFLAERERARG